MSENISYGSMLDLLRELMESVTELADSAQLLGGETLLPTASSPAMHELAEERRFVNEYWPEPIKGAHSVAGILKVAACDHLRGYATLFASEPPPVFAHLALLRAGLDACGQGFWMSQADIGPESRVQRFQARRLADAEQISRSGSPLPDKNAHAQRIIDKVRAGAKELGWPVSRDKCRCGAVFYPKPRSYIGALVDHNLTPEQRDGLGDLLWWFGSGVTHSSNYALFNSVELADDGEATPTGIERGVVSTDGRQVALLTTALGQAFCNFIEMYLTLMGWTDERWNSARTRFQQQSARYHSMVKQAGSTNPEI